MVGCSTGSREPGVDVGDGVRLRVRTAAGGRPVVLLHGHPRTHTTWYRVAPALAAAGHAVVCPDLRGYGGSEAGHHRATTRRTASARWRATSAP